jgi:hypothetical protein
MKKRIFALALAGVMVFAAAVSVEAQSYKVAGEYKGDKTQGPVWYYMVRIAGGPWQELKHVSTLASEYRSWGDNWQASSNPNAEATYFSLCTWEGVVTAESGNKDGKKYEVAVAFKAPSAGRITIANFSVVSHGPEAPADPPLGPVAVTFLHGSTQLGSTVISGRTGTVRGVNADVKAGDMVYIVVDPQRVDVTNVILDNLAVNFTAQ